MEARSSLRASFILTLTIAACLVVCVGVSCAEDVEKKPFFSTYDIKFSGPTELVRIMLPNAEPGSLVRASVVMRNLIDKSMPLPQNLWVIIASFHANHRVFIGYELKKLVSNLTVEFCECRQLEKYGIATDLETQLDET